MCRTGKWRARTLPTLLTRHPLDDSPATLIGPEMCNVFISLSRVLLVSLDSRLLLLEWHRFDECNALYTQLAFLTLNTFIRLLMSLAVAIIAIGRRISLSDAQLHLAFDPVHTTLFLRLPMLSYYRIE